MSLRNVQSSQEPMIPLQPNFVQSQPNFVQSQPNFVQSQPNFIPSQPTFVPSPGYEDEVLPPYPGEESILLKLINRIGVPTPSSPTFSYPSAPQATIIRRD